MSGNFQCPQGQICSDEFGTAVGSKNTNLFLRTSTAITQGAGTQVTGGTTTLYTWVPDTTSGLSYGTGQGNWQPAAKSTDGKNWSLLKDSNGKQVLGADAANSLVTPTGNLNKNVAAQTTKTLQSKGGLTPQQSKAVVKTNAADGQSAAGDQQGAATKEDFNAEVKNLQSSIKDGSVRTKYDNYFYPLDMRSTKQDRVKFTMFRYSPKPFQADKLVTGDAFGKREVKDPMGSVTLPIQPSIIDSNPVDWGSETMDAGEQAFAGLSASAIFGGAEGASAAAEGAAAGAPQVSSSLKTAVGAKLAEQAAGLKGGLLQRLTGGIVNPNMELLFKGPQLRTFTFTFKLSAREEKESQEIRKIIRLFKQGMSVKRASSNLFLKSPNIFQISYIYGETGKPHPWMNSIKECALQNFSVNYTPEGNYATYADGAMTSYEITMTFGEIEPLYDDDYTELDGDKDTQIGY